MRALSARGFEPLCSKVALWACSTRGGTDPGQFCSRALQESGAGLWGETGGNPDTGVLAQKLGKQKADEWDSCVNQLQRRGADPRLEWGMLNLQSRI